MRRRSSPGLGQWVMVTFLVVVLLFLLYRLFQYGTFRSSLPAGLSVAGINVGGRTLDDAAQLLNERYLDAPIIVLHGSTAIELSPANDAEFKLDMETMRGEADFQRSQQDFWAGFWGFLWARPVEVEQVELRATHNPRTLEESLEIIAARLDTPSQPPQPIPSSLSFKPGEAGIQTDVVASLDNVAAALYRPTNREAQLVLERVVPERPELSLLARLIINHMQDFEQNFGGVVGVFILDLNSGDEISVNGDIPFSAMNIAKLPIVLTTFRVLDGAPTVEQRQLIQTTLTDMGTASPNVLLGLIGGDEDGTLGAQLVTETMRKIGLVNTFVAAPYETDVTTAVETPANVSESLPTSLDSAMQTTPEEMGTLLAMLYYCAYHEGGALVAAFPTEITADECRLILDIIQTNFIGSLIEEGVPAGTPVGHEQGWIGDTHGDAGIVYSPNGDYVIVEFLYKRDWLEWEISSPLMADISRATYNFFNFSEPFLGNASSN